MDWPHTYHLAGTEASQPFRFYTGQRLFAINLIDARRRLAAGERTFLLVGDREKAQVEGSGLPYRTLLDMAACRITMIRPRLLSPRTREGACPRYMLLELVRP